MSKDFIPYSRPNISEEDIKAVSDALRNPMISQGGILLELEKALAEVSQSKFAVGYSSGTAAVHGMYFAAGIGEGDEVIVPALTFACTANAVIYLDAKPVFADIDPDTFCLDPKSVASCITDRTKAIVNVDFAGHPGAYNELRQIADEHGLKLLSDAAHAPLGSFQGNALANHVDMAALSFNPVKNMTGGEGGAVICNNGDDHKKAIMFRLHGMTRNKDWLVNEAPAGWYYEMQNLGFNYKLSELHAALALNQLSRLERFNRRRKEIAEIYFQKLVDLPLVLPPNTDGHNWHLFVIRLAETKLSRDELFTRLRAAAIGVQLHYIPVPMHPFYMQRGFTMDGLDQTRNYFEQAISIPCHPGMSDADVQRVVETLNSLLRA